MIFIGCYYLVSVIPLFTSVLNKLLNPEQCDLFITKYVDA